MKSNDCYYEFFYDGIQDIIADGRETAFLYARVSTKHIEQESSLEAQRIELMNFAKRNNLLVIGIFVEKESAKSDIARKGYMKMVEATTRYRPTYIVAKCSDRLNRSVMVSSQLLSICRSSNTQIWYYMSGMIVDPNNPSHVMMSNMTASIDESISLMQHVKAVDAHERKCRDKRLNSNNNTMGYRFNKLTGQMEIYEPEAVLVRKMFEMRVYEDKGCTAIAKYFGEKGLMGYGGNKYITETAILKYLRNTAYIGKMYFNKGYTEFNNGIGGKSVRRERPKEEWICVPVPPIVSEEIFYLAQQILDENGKRLKAKTDAKTAPTRFVGSHIFASKVFCASCGSSFVHKYANRKETISTYICSERKKAVRKHRRKNDEIAPFDLSELACKNEYKKIKEDTLIQVVSDAITLYKEHEETIYDNLYDAIKEVILKKKASPDNSMADVRKELSKLEMQKDKIAQAYIDAIPEMREAINTKFKAVVAQIDELKAYIQKEDKAADVVDARLEKINQVRDAISAIKNAEKIDREVVQRYIDRIIVNMDGTLDVIMHYDKTYSVAVPNVERPHLLEGVGNNPMRGMTEVFLPDMRIPVEIWLQD